MTSAQIRQSYLDFFKSKGHTIVPSSSLMPDSPGLLFTNAGMNQFVPIFLNERKPDVSKWPGVVPGSDTRAADTQKCIRAGGKHNDLEDVGLDTYHHTFFEMLGNWSFGDYFKKEAIEWAWELVVGIWKFPPNRLYATIYNPDKSKNDPAERDEEAWNFWAEKFRSVGLDPAVHIVNGNKKDNFWMMGETGPCGPCSELHVDLTQNGDTKGALVNKGSSECIEIWNLVFIQFNANPDGTFSLLPAKHVDTGMGFERVAGIIQCTKNFTKFGTTISNYETDIFRPLFEKLEQLSGKKYKSTLPGMRNVEARSASMGTAAMGITPAPGVVSRALAGNSGASDNRGAKYSKRRLPHFERPWGKYMVSFSTREHRQLTPAERDIVLASVLYAHEHRQYQLFAACVMPDHVHLLFEPQIKEQDKEGKPVFWSLTEILQGIKSTTAHRINKAAKVTGVHVWEEESFDRLIRGDADLEEKFHYICRNPWDGGVVPPTENYKWLWTPDVAMGSAPAPMGRAGAPPAVADAPSATSERSKLADVSSTSNAPEFPARARETAPEAGAVPMNTLTEQEKIDIAFRVIADHIRTLSFSIADGIQPGNTDRNYVLRRILRRAVRYGRTLGFHEPFFYKLVDVLAEKMGHVFPEILAKRSHVEEVIKVEEEAFNKTLDSGLQIFDQLVSLHERVSKLKPIIKPAADRLAKYLSDKAPKSIPFNTYGEDVVAIVNSITKANYQLWQKVATNPEALLISLSQKLPDLLTGFYNYEDLSGKDVSRLEFLDRVFGVQNCCEFLDKPANVFWGNSAFLLYDTYGFPLDLTELLARERGLTIDTAGFEKLMEEQRARARAAQKKEIVSVSNIDTSKPTKFVGYDSLQTPAKVQEVVNLKDKFAVVLDCSPLYAEMGGQVGDTGELILGGQLWRIVNTQKVGNTWLHFLGTENLKLETLPPVDAEVTLSVDKGRRDAIQRHHTVTHLLHWALHEVASKEASQKGSFVGPDKLTFDFNNAPLTKEQVADIEKLVNERILENVNVSWTEVPYADVKGRKDVMQFFGEKYGDKVRVVQIGGQAGALDGYSMELCGGTHTRATGEIGLFRIVGENAIAAGVRRIEAVAGLTAYEKAKSDLHLIESIAAKVNSPVGEIEKKIETLLAQQKDLEKQLKAVQQKQAAGRAKELVALAKNVNGTSAIIENLGEADGDTLQTIADSLKANFKGVIVLGGVSNGAVSLIAAVTPEFTAKVQAGKIIQTIAPIVGGKGGGRPDNARGGGKDAGKLDEALAKAKSVL